MALKTITTNGGARFTVDADSAPKFLALLNGLEAGGVAIKGDQSGGYNDRNIAGTSTKSQHAFGRAVDVNWTDNPRGKPGAMPAELARRLAAEHGFEWGGYWKNPDPMHFEVRRGAPRPMQERGLTAVAGLSAPSAPQQRSATQAPAASAEKQLDLQQLLAGLFGGGSAPEAAQPTATAPTQGVLKSLGDTGQDSGLPEATRPQMAALPGAAAFAPRGPVDLNRLRQVLASRARLGSGGVT